MILLSTSFEFIYLNNSNPKHYKILVMKVDIFQLVANFKGNAYNVFSEKQDDDH